MEIARPNADLLVVGEHGYGKRTAITAYPLHHRGGKGVTTMRVTEKTGTIADMQVVDDEDRLLIITAGGIVIRCPVNEIRRIGRATEGVRVINLEPGDRVVSIERVKKAEPKADSANGGRNHALAALMSTNQDAAMIAEAEEVEEDDGGEEAEAEAGEE
jgi:DNA gyrase subunit A